MKKILLSLILVSVLTVLCSAFVSAAVCPASETDDCSGFDGTDQTTCESHFWYGDGWNGTGYYKCYWENEEGACMAGLTCTPPEGGLSVGDTITENTTLNQSYTGATDVGFTIGADDITLDCNGYDINGTDTDDSIGIFISNHENVTIKNCNIANFQKGIKISNTNYSNLQNNNFNFNGIASGGGGGGETGISLYQSNHNNISSQEVSYDAGVGILLNQSDHNKIDNNYVHHNNFSGIRLQDSDSNNIMDNNITNNGLGVSGDDNKAKGIRLRESFYNNITSNNILDNNGVGITLWNSNNTYVYNNLIQNSSLKGMKLSAQTCKCVITQNNITANAVSGGGGGEGGETGIELFYARENNITSNIISGDGGNGIEVKSGTAGNYFYNNEIYENSQSGISLNFAHNSTYDSNKIYNNTMSGMYLLSSSDNYLINMNIISNDEGLYFTSSSHNNTISNNTVTSNAVGINISSSNDNLIYNNYFNNTINVEDDGENDWNTSYQPGNSIIGTSYIGGNYWSDYNGADTSEPFDYIGNANLPYKGTASIDNGGDWLPLTTKTSTTGNGGDPIPEFSTKGLIIALVIIAGSLIVVFRKKK